MYKQALRYSATNGNPRYAGHIFPLVYVTWYNNRWEEVLVESDDSSYAIYGPDGLEVLVRDPSYYGQVLPLVCVGTYSSPPSFAYLNDNVIMLEDNYYIVDGPLIEKKEQK